MIGRNSSSAPVGQYARGLSEMAHSGTETAFETTKQIITLSTGMIALTITFAEKFTPKAGDIVASLPLKVSWMAFGVTIAFGVWTLMAITGSVNAAMVKGDTPDADTPNIRIPAILMVVAFVVGIGCAIGAGFVRFT